MKKIEGFYEKYGIEVDKMNYIEDIFNQIARDFSYEQIVLPIVEDADSYSEQIVGKSPWPEWNRKGCFFFNIENYYKTYENGKSKQVLLIPEGTISVTRWLANCIEKENINFPLRLFYSLECYRNELITLLDDNSKMREFHQFGLEILGTNNIQADVEILFLICKMLENINVDRSNIRIRLNDIRVFLHLIELSKIEKEDVITLKELLDKIAESYAKNDTENLKSNKNVLYNILNKYIIDDKIFEQWRAIIEHQDYELTNVLEFLDDIGREYYKQIIEIKNAFNEINIYVAIDPCVIRSHEYYTGLSFEIDVISENKSYLEIAGGGRYDRLVEHFLTQRQIKCIPCTGFAFGTERLIKMTNDMGLFNVNRIIEKKYQFQKSIYYDLKPLDNSVAAYLKVINDIKQYPIKIKI